jgi:hypothetical protein
MNESIDNLPFTGGRVVGRKRRALAALTLLTRSGAALMLGATLIHEPKTVLTEFGYNQGAASSESDTLVEMILGVWICAWALFSIYTIGFGSVQDKKACAVTNAAATCVCVAVASATPGFGGLRDLSALYLELAAAVVLCDSLTFLLCGAGPRLVRVNSKSWIRLDSDEDAYKDPMLNSAVHAEVTTIKRINSHTQLFTRSSAAGSDKKSI